MDIKLFNKNFAMVLNHVYNDVYMDKAIQKLYK